MMSVLGLPGRPPRDQLSLCGVVITGEPGAATKAYRHDYNLLLPQIVSPVALPSTALGCLQQSSLTSHLFIQQQLTYQLSHSVSVCSNTTVTTTVPPSTLNWRNVLDCWTSHGDFPTIVISLVPSRSVTWGSVSRSEMFSVVVVAPYKANVSDNLRSDVVLGVSLVSAWCVCRCNQNQEILSNISQQHKALPARLGSSIWTPSVALILFKSGALLGTLLHYSGSPGTRHSTSLSSILSSWTHCMYMV